MDYAVPPSLGILCERMTPTHAADWKVIGTLLGIPYEELKKIEADYPRNPECCCNKMWGKWLETNSNAIWNKLWAVILSLAVSCVHGDAINGTPSLKDLYEFITPRYAADWKVIGTLLDVPKGELKIIRATFPTDLKQCCNNMWEYWLDTDTTASWKKVFAAIGSPAISTPQCSSLECASEPTIPSSNPHNEQLTNCRLYCSYHRAGHIADCRIVEQQPCFKDRTIDLQQTKLLQEDVECVAEFVGTSSIKAWLEVNLSYCGICGHIYTMYCKLSRCIGVTIKVLQLIGNNITSVDASCVSGIVVNCKVQKLFINDNHGIGESEQLYFMLRSRDTNLKELHMLNVKLTKIGVEYLFRALQHNNTLEELKLGNNNITDDACETITTALQMNNRLVKLFIWNNPFGRVTSEFILCALKRNTSLVLLVLPYHDEVTNRKLESLLEDVNKTREDRRCQVKLSFEYL